MAVYGEKFPKRTNRAGFDLQHIIEHNAAVDFPPHTSAFQKTIEESHESGDQKSRNDIIGGIIEEFLDGGIDSDKLLIAAILYILIKEGADIKLIIALGYILM
ncbi:hypothetical protein [Ruminococcus flavefaciens]|uniref:hypothetical protein n=1 Tax=Ruminococcus flavefaciens TaxID=1265 RepID=UPI0026EA445B|nr:hypothetical protein [Ruminococcus flavefaciens]